VVDEGNVGMAQWWHANIGDFQLCYQEFCRTSKFIFFAVKQVHIEIKCSTFCIGTNMKVVTFKNTT
jgi:hypothetical protein